MTASTVLYVGPESAVSAAVVSAVESGAVPLPVRRVSTRAEACELLDRVTVGGSSPRTASPTTARTRRANSPT